MSMFNEISWECELSAKLVSIYAKRFSPERWSWIRKEVVFYSLKQTTRRMGQSRRADDVDIRRKLTPSLPIHESIIQRRA